MSARDERKTKTPLLRSWPGVVALFGSCPHLCCIVDRNGRFRRVNGAAEAFFGRGTDELVGDSFTRLVDPEDRGRILDGIAAADDTYNGTVSVRMESGSSLPRRASWQFTREPGSDLVVAWGTDVTESRAIIDELEATIERLQLLLAERTRELAEARTRAEDAHRRGSEEGRSEPEPDLPSTSTTFR